MRSIISRVKEVHKDNDKLIYMVFDIIVAPDMPYWRRRELLEKVMSRVANPLVRLVPTMARCELPSNEADEALAHALSDGYEGVVMKHPSFLYPVSNLRINDMIKRKPQNDEDYIIESAYEGDDAHKGLIIFNLRDPVLDYVKFACTPAWSHDERK
jgi:ATP-dependent DNA ligase